VHYPKRPVNKYKPLWFVTLVSLFLVLTACSTTPTPVSKETEFSHLSTLPLSASDNQADIEKRYGGKAIVFSPEAGFAILGFSENQGQLSALAVSPNAVVSTPAKTMKITSSVWGAGASAWGGGASAWGGGWSAWAGGWSAWGGGSFSIPQLPGNNRALWSILRLPQAQSLSRQFGSGIKVAVLDTGFDLAHPMFSGRLAPSTEWKDFIDGDTNPQEVAGSYYGHGTGVAGIIAQIAPKATLLPVRVLNSEGVGDVSTIVSAIDHAIKMKANVINLSLMTNVDVPELKTMVQLAAQNGIYVVMAAGNDALNSIYYPAAYAKTATNNQMLLSVGSATSSDTLSSFSNYGTALEFVAPGEQIYSSYPDQRIAYFTGTSFSAPVIAGTVALNMSETTYRSSSESYLGSEAVAVSSYKRPDMANTLLAAPDSRRKSALLVAGSSTATSDETVLSNTLKKMGYNVTVLDDNALVSTSTDRQDIVVVTASSDPAVVGTKLRDVIRPVIVLDDGHYTNMKMTGLNTTTTKYSGVVASQTSLLMASLDHSMTAGLTGTPTVQTTATRMVWGTPSSSAITIASITNTTAQSTVFAYARGVTMVGMNAPERRVGFYLDVAANSWTKQGKRLFEAAVTWASSGN
jgi:hypothetical protein